MLATIALDDLLKRTDNLQGLTLACRQPFTAAIAQLHFMPPQIKNGSYSNALRIIRATKSSFNAVSDGQRPATPTVDDTYKSVKRFLYLSP